LWRRTRLHFRELCSKRLRAVAGLLALLFAARSDEAEAPQPVSTAEAEQVLKTLVHHAQVRDRAGLCEAANAPEAPAGSGPSSRAG